MINFKSSQLSEKEEKIIETLISDISDIYRDFYVTKNNLRLYIRENIHILFDCLKYGDKIVYSNEDGLAIVTGYSDNSNRKYLKILAKSEKSVERLLKVLLWNVKCDLWIKLKQNNPLINILTSKDDYKGNNLKFIIKGYRGKEVLLLKSNKFNKDNSYKGDKDVIDNKNEN